LLYDLRLVFPGPDRHFLGETMQGNPVFIRCDACGARFRFDRALIAGYRGARFRCRGCGHPIAVSVPDEPPVPRGTAFTVIRANPQEQLSFPNADPVAEEAPAAKPVPDNLVDLQRIRESHRGPVASGALDLSDRIGRYILASVPLCAETEPEVPPAGAPARRIATDSAPDGQKGFLEGMFRWRDPDPPKRAALLSSIRIPLLFIAFGTVLAYIGFQLVVYLAR
jgi:predicted Zn finger-like uncharacterized protein